MAKMFKDAPRDPALHKLLEEAKRVPRGGACEQRHAVAHIPASTRQVGGTHYQKTIQPWDAMEAWMTPEAFAGFLQGNAIKYLARYRDKGGVQDLEKAQHYLEKLVEVERKRPLTT